MTPEVAMQEPGADSGVRLSEAYKHFCPPDIRESFIEAGNAAGWSQHRVLSQIDGLTPEQERRKAAVEAYKAAQADVAGDIISKLRDGRLVATGFVVGPSGRDPDADRRPIPEDVLQARNCRFHWKDETVSGNELTFIDVRLYPTFEAPEAEKLLIWCSLSECFQRVVTDDWLRREMEETMFRRFPGWKFDATSFRLVGGDRWPVRFENWLSPEYTVTEFKHPITFVGEGKPPPPEDIVAIRTRAENQARRLINWLRDGALVAEGIKEPPDHELTRARIVQDWWSRAGVEMDITDNALWLSSSYEDGRKFSEIRIVDPSSLERVSLDHGPKEKPQKRKRKGGRPPKWPREDAIREVRRFAEARGGWDCPFSIFENHLKDWFFEKCGDCPSDSTVKRYVRAAVPEGDSQN